LLGRAQGGKQIFELFLFTHDETAVVMASFT
jgi:hypothetical protein